MMAKRRALAAATLVAILLPLVASTKLELKHKTADALDDGAIAAILDRPHTPERERGRVLTERHHAAAASAHRGPKHRARAGGQGGTTLYEIARSHVLNQSAAHAPASPPAPPPADALLHGSVVTTGYYAMELHLGTPPQTFEVIVDTGSTIAYVPCGFCGDKCGVHINKPFQPQDSGTAEFINCVSATCATFCGSRRCSCRSALEFLPHLALPMVSVCSYARKYQEQSSSRGLLLTDVLHLGRGSALGDQTRFGFGCETEETGAIHAQNADGVVGFGNNPSSLPNQLVRQGAMANTFAICMGGPRGGGALFLGDETLPDGAEAKMRYAKLKDNRRNPEFYSVEMRSLRVGGNRLNVPASVYLQGFGAVVDTGTTFLYLPDRAHRDFNQLLEAHIGIFADKVQRIKSPDARYPGDVCYAAVDPNLREEDLMGLFPPLSLAMEAPEGGRVTVDFTPESYLFEARGRARTKVRGYCVGVYANGNAGTLLGAVLLRDYLVHFDLRNKRIGFAPQKCDEFNR